MGVGEGTACSLDLARLLETFALHAQCPELEAFRDVWKEMRFAYIHLGIPIEHDGREYTQLLFSTALAYLTINSDVNTRMFALYAVFFLYQTQIENPKVRIHISPDIFEELCQLHAYGIEHNEASIIQILAKLVEEDALEFHGVLNFSMATDQLKVRPAPLRERATHGHLHDIPTVEDMLNLSTLQDVLDFKYTEECIASMNEQVLCCQKSCEGFDELWGKCQAQTQDMVGDLRALHGKHVRQLRNTIMDFDVRHAEEEFKRRNKTRKRKHGTMDMPLTVRPLDQLPANTSLEMEGDMPTQILIARTLRRNVDAFAQPTLAFTTPKAIEDRVGGSAEVEVRDSARAHVEAEVEANHEGTDFEAMPPPKPKDVVKPQKSSSKSPSKSPSKSSKSLKSSKSSNASSKSAIEPSPEPPQAPLLGSPFSDPSPYQMASSPFAMPILAPSWVKERPGA